MRSPTPRPAKRTKALPPIYVEMRWQGGAWGWCDVRLDNPPSYRVTKHERSIGYRIVKYIPAPRKRRSK